MDEHELKVFLEDSRKFRKQVRESRLRLQKMKEELRAIRLTAKSQGHFARELLEENKKAKNGVASLISSQSSQSSK